MANYSDDQDLTAVRPDILQYNRTSWAEYHVEAKSVIDRAIECLWYKKAAADRDIDWAVSGGEFDPARLDASQLTRLSVYKVLEMAYLWLANVDKEPDGYFRLSEYFGDKYEEELRNLLALGLDYDWDLDDTIEAHERLTPQFRRLERM